jgi:hypothetical protein
MEIENSINSLLFKADLMRLDFGYNTDEYFIEAQEINNLLINAQSVEDVAEIVYEVFCKNFGMGYLPSKQSFMEVSSLIWDEYIKEIHLKK